MVNTIAGAIANVKAWGAGVSGIAASYTLKEFYQAIASGNVQLPCLIVIDELGEQSGFQTLAFMGGAGEIEFKLEHHLLTAAVAGTADFPASNDGIVTAIDAYVAALTADPFFTVSGAPGTHVAVQSSWKKQQDKWGETVYHAVLFRLSMRLYL